MAGRRPGGALERQILGGISIFAAARVITVFFLATFIPILTEKMPATDRENAFENPILERKIYTAARWR